MRSEVRRSTAGILSCPDRAPCSTDGILRSAQDDTVFSVILGQNCDCRRGRKQGACLRRRNGDEGCPTGLHATTIPTSGQVAHAQGDELRCHSEAEGRRIPSVSHPSYGRDPRVPRRGIAALRMTPFPVILGQIRDCRRGREKGTVLRRRCGAIGASIGVATTSTSGQIAVTIT